MTERCGFVGSCGSLRPDLQRPQRTRSHRRFGCNRSVARRVRMCTEADVESSSALAMDGKTKMPVPVLMLVLPNNSVQDLEGLEKFVAEAVEGGVNVVQVRESVEEYEYLESALTMLTEKFPDVTILVNSNVNVAAQLDGVGIHLPESLCKFHGVARETTSDDKIIGSSVHSVAAAEKAVTFGADYLIVGTTFETESHPGKVPEGILMLKMIGRSIGPTVPMIAIGGIVPDNVSKVVEAGAAGVAVLSGLAKASDVKEAARQYREALDACWKPQTE